MPASLKDLRSRIKSVKNTQQITKAMKLVSTAKFGKAQAAAVQARPYCDHISNLVGRLLSEDVFVHPLLSPNSSLSSLLVVFSSERGLCGGFNNNVVKLAWKTFLQNKENGIETYLLVIGKKSLPLLSRLRKSSGINSKANITNWYDLEKDASVLFKDPHDFYCVSGYFDKPNQEKAFRLFEMLKTLYVNHSLKSIQVVYNRFQSALTQIPILETVVPFANETISNGSPSLKNHYILEPSRGEVLEDLVPKALQAKVNQILLDSVASEHGARMTAMDSATRNAKDMEKKLQLLYQRARQAAITKELVEIISGAEAL